MSITDNNQQEIIHLERPYRCMSWCCFCCLQEMEVQSPPGTTIGYVTQESVFFLLCKNFACLYECFLSYYHCSCTFWIPEFTISNESRQPVLKIKGPCCTCRCFADINFQVREKVVACFSCHLLFVVTLRY